MRYWIRIDNSDRGPYSAAEIIKTFGANLPSNTQCAEVGKDTWSTLGDLLPDIGSAPPSPEEPEPPLSPNVKAVADGFIKKIIAFPILAITGVISAPFFIRYDRTSDPVWGWLFFVVLVLGISASIIVPAYVIARFERKDHESVFSKMPFIRLLFRKRTSKKRDGNPFTQEL